VVDFFLKLSNAAAVCAEFFRASSSSATVFVYVLKGTHPTIIASDRIAVTALMAFMYVPSRTIPSFQTLLHTDS
jgi:hypothetical protein